MEKEDDDAEEEGDDGASDANGEPDGPIGTVMPPVQEHTSQSPRQEDEMRDTLMEDGEPLSDVTDLSSPAMVP